MVQPAAVIHRAIDLTAGDRPRRGHRSPGDRTVTKPERCNESSEKGRTGRRARCRSATDARSLFAAQVAEGLTCTNTLVTAGNRALCELGWQHLSRNGRGTRPAGTRAAHREVAEVSADTARQAGRNPLPA